MILRGSISLVVALAALPFNALLQKGSYAGERLLKIEFPEGH